MGGINNMHELLGAQIDHEEQAFVICGAPHLEPQGTRKCHKLTNNCKISKPGLQEVKLLSFSRWGSNFRVTEGSSLSTT